MRKKSSKLAMQGGTNKIEVQNSTNLFHALRSKEGKDNEK